MPTAEMELEEAQKNPLFVDPDAIPDEQHIKCFLINGHAIKFELSGNPIHAFEAFVQSVDAGIYPPVNVLRWAAAAFGQYLSAEGEKSLDKCFGTSGGASGQDPAYKRLLIKQRRDSLVNEVATLIGLGATRSEAAEMVALSASMSGKSAKKKLRDIDASTLETYHKKDKVTRDPDTIAFIKQHPQIIRDLLEIYPATEGAKRLKRKYKR